MSFASLIDHVFLHTPQAGRGLIESELSKAFYEFLERSQAYTTDFDDLAMDTVIDQRPYDFTTAANNFTLIKIIGVKYNEGLLYTDQFEHQRPNTIELQFDPDSVITDGVKVKAVLTTRNTTTAELAPSWIYDRWSEHIAAGALFRLMIMRRRPWSDPEMAVFYRTLFFNGIAESLKDQNKNIGANPGNEVNPVLPR